VDDASHERPTRLSEDHTAQLPCAECRQPYNPEPQNATGFCSWDCFDVKPRPNAPEAFLAFLGPEATMQRVDSPDTHTAPRGA
jgi:hypothetical protein